MVLGTLINIHRAINVKSESIYVDDYDVSKNLKQWQKLIGFVSQNIFLKNDTILNVLYLVYLKSS